MRVNIGLIVMLILACFSSSCLKDKAAEFVPSVTFHTVQMSNMQFNPDTLSIYVGDTVRWTNNDGWHNVNATTTTFPNNPDGFGNAVTSNWTFDHVFTIAGTYEYRCDAHYISGMKGVIIVQ